MLHFWTGCHNEAVIRQSLHLPEGPDLTFQSVTHPLPSALSSLRGQPFPMNTRVFKIALSEQGELGATESLSQTYQNSAAGTHCPVRSMEILPGFAAACANLEGKVTCKFLLQKLQEGVLHPGCM